MQSNKNIFYGEVVDIDDPKGIGRIRVEPKIELIKYIYLINKKCRMNHCGKIYLYQIMKIIRLIQMEE